MFLGLALTDFSSLLKGKNGTGILDPIQASKQRRRQGLGFGRNQCNGYKSIEYQTSVSCTHFSTRNDSLEPDEVFLPIAAMDNKYALVSSPAPRAININLRTHGPNACSNTQPESQPSQRPLADTTRDDPRHVHVEPSYETLELKIERLEEASDAQCAGEGYPHVEAEARRHKAEEELAMRKVVRNLMKAKDAVAQMKELEYTMATVIATEEVTPVADVPTTNNALKRKGTDEDDVDCLSSRKVIKIDPTEPTSYRNCRGMVDNCAHATSNDRTSTPYRRAYIEASKRVGNYAIQETRTKCGRPIEFSNNTTLWEGYSIDYLDLLAHKLVERAHSGHDLTSSQAVMIEI
ncbi:hypothetical protein BDV96DRAFT_597005 [Lophiotrema nucula]|uniref:Uncharacterized protein n=1 Tax=Lophiotrema nucula TaxID=690887 RepID=A0A6A5ZII5_9PLEO|nr:hypothetical protein BDV96DRAFT_597005 [Lophiotrema nucula]